MLKKSRKLFLLSIIFILGVLLFPIIYISIVRPTIIDTSIEKDVDKIVIYGDTRSSYITHKKIVKLIEKEKPNLVIHSGDIVSNSNNIVYWLTFAMVENRIWNKNIEYVPTRGNHEVNMTIYKNIYTLPNNSTYFSFKRNGLKFIILDVTHYAEGIDSEQEKWLRSELAEDIPKVISIHIPMFTSGKYGSYFYVSPILHNLFMQSNVLFVFSAHVHAYERSYANGINYIVTAGGGAPLYDDIFINPYRVLYVKKNNYTILTKVEGGYNLIAKDIDGQVIDNFTVKYPREE